MSAAWILYALAVGSGVALCALALEQSLRLLRLPVRWIWASALLAAVVLVFAAPLRAPDARTPEPISLEHGFEIASEQTIAAGEESLGSRASLLRVEARALLAGALARAARAIPAAIDAYLLRAWVLGSVAILGIFAAVQLRLLRTRRRWPRGVLDGEPVRVAPAAGPAVVGLIRPEVVVPRWFLSLGAEPRRLVLTHEREHIRAGDHLLLALGWIATALLCWHPAAWWILSRLRFAIELDCDARVLRQGADRAAYGTVLIDLAHRAAGLRLGIAARAEAPSHLERRLIAMTARRVRFAAARAGGLGVLALAGFLAACEATLPTAADIGRMDVAAAEAAAKRLALLEDDDRTTYLIDGTPVSAEEARKLTEDMIASIEVVRAREGEWSRIYILTDEAERQLRDGALTVASGDLVHFGDSIALSGLGATSAAQPLYVVDGIARPGFRVAELAPSEIGSIRVLKGEAAVRQYGVRGANGVVVLSTNVLEGVRTNVGQELAAITIERRPLHVLDGTLAATPAGRVRIINRDDATGSEPLYVVDGVVRERFSMSEIPAAEIQFISVLKDASATAPYGPRGANGVILITTRRGAPADETPSPARAP